jgi:mRNA interferase MazF
MVINQYDIVLINLDPTVGSEIRKSRPCVIISPNEMINNIRTVIIAPMTTTSKQYPSRVSINFQKKDGFIALDQIRTVDKIRLIKKLGKLDENIIKEMKIVIKEMLVD